MGEAALRERVFAARELFRRGRERPRDRIAAMALLREVADRTLGQRPYPVQMAGALGILGRCIVEMATGEGKTLTAALAAAACGWRGKGCHVVTSNDYLAARDAESLSAFYDACGLTCASVVEETKSRDRRDAYARDITYLTSKAAAGDFLRDGLALKDADSHARLLTRTLAGERPPDIIQRGLACAIVDEADSVLCDGGSTPLLISAPGDNAPRVEQYMTAAAVAEKLRRGSDFLVNEMFREAKLTGRGRKKALEAFADPRNGAGGTHARRAWELSVQAVEAREFYRVGRQYIVSDGKVVIVDEATGRIMPDHEWRDGLHQAVSAKEGLKVEPPKNTNAQCTFQDFFLRYPVLGGMTGTAWEARGEFLQFYRLFVARLPTHRPCRRRVAYRAFHATEADKLRDIVGYTLRRRKEGRSVLVGTRSIEASERIAAALREAGFEGFEVLNAVHHKREAEIVARAGRAYEVTVATNMAGRGTDIKLDDSVREKGGLTVILTERHDSSRVDRQLHGRCARQGDPGEVAEIISLRDALFAALPFGVRPMIRLLLALGSPGRWLAWKAADWCQWRGDRRAFRMRRQLVKGQQQFSDLISYSGARD